MNKYVLVYHGSPQFDSKEDGMNHMVAWKAWMTGLGAAVVDPGLPLGPSKTVHSDKHVEDNGGANPAAGITTLQADTEAEVLEMVRACPHLSAGGSIEVAPAMNLDMG